MTTRTGLLADLTDHIEIAGTRPPAVRAARRWATLVPVLDHRDPAAVVAAARHGGTGMADEILAALITVGASDDWAGLTALGVLVPRLSRIVAGWARHGAKGEDLVDLEAELVARTWQHFRAATAGPPLQRPGLALVDAAWARTRTRRRSELRHARRCSPIGDRTPIAVHGDTRSGADLATTAIADALTVGRLRPGPARALWATRVAGYSTAETATAWQTTPGALRADRARATARLAAGVFGGEAA